MVHRPTTVSTVTLLAAIGVTACSPQPSPAAISSRSAELAREEAPGLAISPGSVQRSGDTLIVRIGRGENITLVDDTTEGDKWVRYVYQGKLAGTPFHLIDVGFYEGGMHLLVDSVTGHKSFVDAAPEPSPGGMFLAVPSMDMEAEYEPTRLTIYAVAADSLQQLWRLEAIKWGPDSVAWHGDDSLLVQQAFPTNSGPGNYVYRLAWVLRGANGWQLQESGP